MSEAAGICFPSHKFFIFMYLLQLLMEINWDIQFPYTKTAQGLCIKWSDVAALERATYETKKSRSPAIWLHLGFIFKVWLTGNCRTVMYTGSSVDGPSETVLGDSTGWCHGWKMALFWTCMAFLTYKNVSVTFCSFPTAHFSSLSFLTSVLSYDKAV